LRIKKLKTWKSQVFFDVRNETRKIPIRINKPPRYSRLLGVSFKNKKASSIVPIGSPIKAIETNATGR
jgi:hypothetical protein